MNIRAHRLLLLSMLSLCFSLSLNACARNQYVTQDTRSTGRLSNETVLLHASTGRLDVAKGRLITGNDAAFQSKLDMIKSAKTSIDAMYYIYAEDFSSSVLTQALLDAALRGVQVRVLVDYQTNYNNLDLFSMMEKYGNTGRGTLEVRLFNRPSRSIVEDAVFLTLGCGEVQPKSGQKCGPAKNAEIEARFRDEQLGGRPAADVGASNINIGNSGLFLSGLYAKDPDLMALAVLEGQSIDLESLKTSSQPSSAQEKQQLKKLGQIYLHSRIGTPFQKLRNKIQLAFIFTVDGKTVMPLHDALTGYFPIERRGHENAERDWEYLTDYLHHKLLLVDQRHVQLGGRNIEDSYHMLPNPLTKKYVFMDTDFRVDLNAEDPTLQRAFEAQWNFVPMVATVAEVRQHAPNDYAANHALLMQAEKEWCHEKQQAAQEACILTEFAERAVPLGQRIEARYEEMNAHATRYWKDYPFARTVDESPTFHVDDGAFVAYVENLPFYGQPGAPPVTRSYGAVNGQEAQYGKRIHSLWLLGLVNACSLATAEKPQRVIFHSAYFSQPSNLLRMLAKMTNGDLDCRHVTLTVLTNSMATTDLSIVNLLAQQSIKAYQEFYASQRNVLTSPHVEYFEYQAATPENACVPHKGQPTQHLSLHTKVSLFGDDMIVGSANGDIRSYMMDSNNGMMIRNAPTFMNDYRMYIDALLKDGSKTLNLTTSYAATSHDQLIQGDRKALECLIDKYGVRAHISAAEITSAEDRVVELMNEAYTLSQAILAGGKKGRDAEARYNRIFKPI
jgi:putative cardiolipin synthase